MALLPPDDPACSHGLSAMGGLLLLVDVGDTTTAEPTEADGTGPSTPFMLVDVEESAAKPTDGPGLER